MDGLGDGGGEVVGLELREAGREDAFRRAQGFEELSGQAGAEAGREGKRQPRQIAVGVVAEGQVREGTFPLE
jgi:hypothetical protein